MYYVSLFSVLKKQSDLRFVGGIFSSSICSEVVSELQADYLGRREFVSLSRQLTLLNGDDRSEQNLLSEWSNLGSTNCDRNLKIGSIHHHHHHHHPQL